MTRIGCRAHDYGKLPAAVLAATLRAKGYNAAQLAMPRAIAGIEDFSHITDKQLAEIRTAFAAQDVEISVLSCYQDLSAPDADTRRTAVDTVKRTLGCQSCWVPKWWAAKRHGVPAQTRKRLSAAR